MTTPVLLCILAATSVQDPVFVETRFHRVHLRNGNFIDGQILSEKPVSLELKL